MNSNPNFIGTHYYSLDAKNRLAVPAKFRFYLEQDKELILTQGLEGCLNLFPQTSWTNLQERLNNASHKNKMEERAFKRMLFASASFVECDEEGRILIPQNLVEYSKLKREVAVIGMGRKIEVWSKILWQQYQKKQMASFARNSAQMEI